MRQKRRISQRKILHDCPAIAAAVDDVAEYVQSVRIGEARLVKQGFELVDGIAVKVGDSEGQECFSFQPSLALSKDSYLILV